jgi:hypothetical protein
VASWTPQSIVRHSKSFLLITPLKRQYEAYKGKKFHFHVNYAKTSLKFGQPRFANFDALISVRIECWEK